jgi:hypothetical protein
MHKGVEEMCLYLAIARGRAQRWSSESDAGNNCPKASITRFLLHSGQWCHVTRIKKLRLNLQLLFFSPTLPLSTAFGAVHTRQPRHRCPATLHAPQTARAHSCDTDVQSAASLLNTSHGALIGPAQPHLP